MDNGRSTKTMKDVYDYLIESGEMKSYDRPRNRMRAGRHIQNCEIIADKIASNTVKAWNENGFETHRYYHDSDGNFLVVSRYGYGMQAWSINVVLLENMVD